MGNKPKYSVCFYQLKSLVMMTPIYIELLLICCWKLLIGHAIVVKSLIMSVVANVKDGTFVNIEVH